MLPLSSIAFFSPQLFGCLLLLGIAILAHGVPHLRRRRLTEVLEHRVDEDGRKPGRSLALLLFVVVSPRHNSTNESDVRDFGRSMTTTTSCVV